MRLTIQVDPTDRGELTAAISQLNALCALLPVRTAAPQAVGTGIVMTPQATGGGSGPLVPPPPSDPGPEVFAHSTVGVEASPIAPEVPPAISTPPSAPVPPAPTPAPLVPAPSAPAAPMSPVGVAVDVSGLPWDGRIHSSNKATNADGTWRKRRGMNDEALVHRIEAELRAAQAAPAVPAAPVPTPSPALAAPPAPPTFPAPPVAAPAVPPAAPVAEVVDTFPALMKRLAPMMAGATPRLPIAELTALLQTLGIASLPLVNSRPDLIPAVWASVEAHLAAKPVSGGPGLPPGTTLQ